LTRIRTRPLEPDDIPVLNAAFCRFVATKRWKSDRTDEQLRCIVQDAPGGPAASWIVEACDGSDWKIVGHHGMCPVRFTYGGQDWLCAKVFNTFVLPEYRDSFLFVRFEMECLREADKRFEANFCTGNPLLRWRKTAGYQGSMHSSVLLFSLQPHHFVCRTLIERVHRRVPSFTGRLKRWLGYLPVLPIRRRSTLALTALSSEQAVDSEFFRTYGDQARLDPGFNLRRDVADLAWRFWRRPGFNGVTLTYTWPNGTRAYAIVDTPNPLFFTLVDISISPRTAEHFALFLNAVLDWCAAHRALGIHFLTCYQAWPEPLRQVLDQCLQSGPWRNRVNHNPHMMLRRLAPLGAQRISALPEWELSYLVIAEATFSQPV
jgi:hypothetical protein